MVNLNFRTSKTGVPILSNADIEADVELLLSKYNKDLLITPQAIDVEDFAENFLKFNLHFDNLSHNGCIWGMMVFNKRKIPVYVPKLKRAEYCPVDPFTVVLDNSLLVEGREVLLRSTLCHECGHGLYHRQIFEEDDDQLALFVDYSPAENVAIAVCRKTDIAGEFRSPRYLITDHDWIEHHAKYFSAAVLMPRSAMRVLCQKYWAHTALQYQKEAPYYTQQLAALVADTFCVSYESAGIRIKQLDLGWKSGGEPLTTLYYPGGTPIELIAGVQ